MMYVAPLIPKNYFISTVIGIDDNKIISFEYALRNAGCEKFNLVPVSSILPPNCIEISKEEGLKKLRIGEIVFCVMGRLDTKMKKNPVSTVITSIKKEGIDNGYFFEHCVIGKDLRKTIIDSRQKTITLLKSLESNENKPIVENPDFFSNVIINKVNNDTFLSDGTDKTEFYSFGWRGISSINRTQKKWMTLLALAVFII